LGTAGGTPVAAGGTPVALGMSRARALLRSKKARNDEFYTLHQDVAAELTLHREHLRGRRIICPCDREDGLGGLGGLGGAFVEFLASHAAEYGIKAVTASGYDPSSMRGVRFQDVDYSQYDLAITNPPFSLFREFIGTMFANRMKFLIVGPANALAYRDVFARVMNDEMWLGHHRHLTGLALPDGTALPKNDALVRYCCWYTNLDVPRRHERLALTEKYDPRKNPAYCNFDGIDVGRTAGIPCDYLGAMGVPLTFLQKYCPDQFEILGSSYTLAGPAPEGLPKGLRGGPAFYLRRPDGGHRRLFFKIVVRQKGLRKRQTAGTLQ
jgi:hypothetical protein